ncbi:MAG: hypothetical protein ACLFSB_12595 [Chitinispirillaceae bacterium]
MHNVSYIRVTGATHIPISFIDLEAGPESVAIMLDPELIEYDGVSRVNRRRDLAYD